MPTFFGEQRMPRGVRRPSSEKNEQESVTSKEGDCPTVALSLLPSRASHVEGKTKEEKVRPELGNLQRSGAIRG